MMAGVVDKKKKGKKKACGNVGVMQWKLVEDEAAERTVDLLGI